jgi:DNA-binding IclR family transcriptional regulator
MMNLPSQPVKGLIEGITVLQELANAREPLSSIEISRRLGLEKTRVNRILKTLAYLGFAYRGDSRRYSSGPGMHILAAQSLSASGLLKTSISHLEDLMRHRLLIALGVLWRDKVSYLFHHLPGTPFHEGIGRVQLHPATKSSIGMALLAKKTDEEIRLIHENSEDMETHSSLDSLLEDIREIRESGFAALSEYPGHHTVAVTIGSPAFAAIAFSGEIGSDEVPAYVEILREKAKSIEEKLRDGRLKS